LTRGQAYHDMSSTKQLVNAEVKGLHFEHLLD